MHRIAIAAVTLLLFACGGSVDGSSATSATSDAAAASATQHTPRGNSDARDTTPDASTAPVSRPLTDTAAEASIINTRTRRLPEFDHESVIWAAHHWADAVPPLREWADANWRQQARERREVVNEFFDVDAFVTLLADEMEASYRAAHDIGHVSATIIGELGSYDADFEEFYIDSLAPGNVLRAYSNRLPFEARVNFVNALDAYALPMKAAEAQALLEQLGPYAQASSHGTRRIEIEIDFRILGARLDPRGNTGTIDAMIERYKLYPRPMFPYGERGALISDVVLVDNTE